MCSLMLPRIIVLFTFPTLLYGQQKENELLMVLAMWRHGDRTPTNLIPTDTKNTWPRGLGELTPRGMAMHYRLGQAIRKRYIGTTDTEMKIIDKFYNAKQIYVRSTDVNRTLISALSNLAGFYPQGDYGNTIPPKDEVDWPAAWQPVPVHTVAHETDNLLNTDAYCPKAWEIYKDKVMTSPEYVNLTKQNQEFLQFLTNKTGYPEVTIANIGKVWGPLYIESLYPETHKWPSWVTQSIFDRMNELKYASDRLHFADKTLARLRGGTLLGDMIGHMQARADCINNTTPDCGEINRRIYWIYSAHDTTEEAFFQVLGNYAGIIGDNRPRYASCSLVEFWSRKYGKSLDVRLLYKANDTETEFEVITQKISGCHNNSEWCSLSIFSARSQEYIPKNWTEECKIYENVGTTTETVTEENCPKREHWIVLTIVFAVTTAILILTTLFFGYQYFRERKQHRETAYSMSFTALQNYGKSGTAYFNESMDKDDGDGDSNKS